MPTKTSPPDTAAKPVDFSGRTLPNLRLRDKALIGADFSAAIAHGARLSKCDLSRAVLAGADWSGAVIRLCRLHRFEAAGAVFREARIEDCAATAADLRGADLSGAGLTDSVLARADLSGADLSGARGESVDFSGADLRAARLASCDLPDADFRGADLSDADLTGGRFAGADFRGARLDGAVTAGAAFPGTRFDDAPEAERPAFATMVERLQAGDLVAALGRETGLGADIRARVEAAVVAADGVDSGALLAEALGALKAVQDPSGTAETRVDDALTGAPNLARLLQAARLDPGMLACFLDDPAAQVPPDLAAGFLGPMAEALGLSPDAEPQEVIDALMSTAGRGAR